jgi:two-component system CheB/CheR fusion protein
MATKRLKSAAQRRRPMPAGNARGSAAPARARKRRAPDITHASESAADHDDAEAPNAPGPFVVGIGASAGGLAALNAFFDSMPPESGLAFVVVTHQHPQHVSLLPELLSRHTRMPVVAAADGMAVVPNHVYVSPPGTNLALMHCKLQLMALPVARTVHTPIDYFLRSLAQDCAERAICVVLSGTGTDGTVGLRAVKGNRGLALVQDPSSAQYDGMPHSAAETQLADYVLRPEAMADALLMYVRTARQLGPEVHQGEALLTRVLPKIFALLRDRLGHDFSGYKDNTIRRRIERRMRVHGLTRASDYLGMLQSEPHENDLLFKELLISVTSFFRDGDAFEALAEVLTQLVDARSHDSTIRVWVAACSTGEEAYSIAMLANELIERSSKRMRLQVFATDLDPHAIETARAGVYPEGIAADVSAARLRRFFVQQGNAYRVCKEIRDNIVFATQNVLRDPPFTRLDLLSCRNLLIYLNTELQRQLLPLFRYTLNPDGLLWLGSSETAAGFTELFTSLDRKAKIYRCKPLVASSLPVLGPHSIATRSGAILEQTRPTVRHGTLGHVMERLLIERFAPPTVVVNERGEVAYVYGHTGAYLELSRGEPRHNVFAMAREGLQFRLQSMLRAAARSDKEIVQEHLQAHGKAGAELVRIMVQRIADPESVRGLFRISFESEPPPRATAKATRQSTRGLSPAAMERELLHTRESLQGAVEELQTSNEDLKSTNEELQSTNEELQSTNEELETSKEELQSLNEELQTVNAELQVRMDELSRVNDDMQNLLNSTDIATLFLDQQLRIQRFTQQARQVVRLIPSDVGRPIGDLVARVRYDSLERDAKRVLSTLMPNEAEVQNLDGQWLLLRMLPYRTSHNVIDGVVITFVDIDRVKRAEQLAAARRFAERIVQTVREPLLVLDQELRIVSSNAAFLRVFDITPLQVENALVFEFANGLLNIPRLLESLREVLSRDHQFEDFEVTYSLHGSSQRRLLLNARRLEDPGTDSGRVLLALHESPCPNLI